MIGRRTLVGWLAMTAALAGCGPKEIDIAVNVISTVCDQDLDPFAGVNAIEVRVTGPGIDTPLLTRVQRADTKLQIPFIPAGPNRVIEVRGLAETSSPRPLSIGRSLPVEIPDVLTDSNKRVDINIFMRRIDSFTRPSSAAAPRQCADMRSLRAAHTATLLRDGRVFIAGGFRLDGSRRVAVSDTEFYDPNKGTFEQGPTMSISSTGATQISKAFHTATLLLNGQVMLYGGEHYPNGVTSTQTTVLIFDVEAGAYGAVPSRSSPPSIARAQHLAIPDGTGRVLIVGGQRRVTMPAPAIVPVPEVEWFDPTTNTISVVTGESLPRIEVAGAAVQDGGVIVVAGGVDATGAVSDSVNFFRFNGSTYVRAGATQQLHTARRAAAGMALTDDKTVLIMGGYVDPSMVVPDASTEAIKTGSNTIDQATAPIGARGEVCAALLTGGGMLVTGGRTTGSVTDGAATLIRFDATKATLTAAAASPLPRSRYLHTCTTLPDGTVLVTGGVSVTGTGEQTVLRDAWIYTPIPGD